jgi:hypothetical protein
MCGSVRVGVQPQQCGWLRWCIEQQRVDLSRSGASPAGVDDAQLHLKSEAHRQVRGQMRGKGRKARAKGGRREQGCGGGSELTKRARYEEVDRVGEDD